LQQRSGLKQSAVARHFAFMDEGERRPLSDEIAHARPLDGERETLTAGAAHAPAAA